MKWLKWICAILTFIFIFAMIALIIVTSIYQLEILFTVVLVTLIFYHLINVAFGIYIYFDKKRVNLTKKSWLFSFLIFPGFSALIFLWTGVNPFGKKKQKKLEKNINYIKEITKFDEQKMVVTDNELVNKIFTFCKNTTINKSCLGDIVFLANKPIFNECINLIRRAKKYIFVNFYIFRDGVFFKAIFNELYEKSKQGVKIFVLYDWVGSRKKVKKEFWKKITEYGFETTTFKRKSFFIVNTLDNSRNHKKSLIIDGIEGVIGGFNIADEYINENKEFHQWRDHMFSIKGEVVKDYLKVFLLDWINYSDGDSKQIVDVIKELLTIKHPKENNKQVIQTYHSFPEKNIWKAFNFYDLTFSMAKKRIWINTPYFYPTEQLENTLIDAATAGIDVRIIVPGYPDDKKFIVHMNRLKYSTWINNGIKIYEYNGFTHCKSIIIDDNLVITGSVNMDARALNINYELANIIYDKKLNDSLAKDFLETTKASTEVIHKIKDKSLIKNIYGKLIMIFLLFFEPLF